jgi:hypothetical protein
MSIANANANAELLGCIGAHPSIFSVLIVFVCLHVQRDSQQWSPLHLAANLGRMDLCCFLVEECHLNVNEQVRLTPAIITFPFSLSFRVLKF